jgi:AraC-like DNA-binding protein
LTNGKLAVARAKAYLREHCSEPVSLQDLALVSGFSRFGLVHAFTKEVGLSPHAYQVHVRIERARALLQHGVSPAAVATTMGFADQSHFTRHFRRVLQVTPSQYAGRSIAWQSRAAAFGSLRAGGTGYSSSYTPLSSAQ